MFSKKINIEEKLTSVRKKEITEEKMLEQVHNILIAHELHHERIENTLVENSEVSKNEFIFNALETDKIYHINHIKKICIDYRLRFLSTKYFKGDLPLEALHKIQALEKEHDTTLKGFKIIAPSKLFKLEDKDDPLLFAPIGNDYYYLIHKWGNDLHPMRKVMMWPFKDIMNLILTLFLLSIVTTSLIPTELFSKNLSTTQVWVLFFFTFKSLIAVALFYGVAAGKNFNPAIWNSKYFNA